MWGTPGWRAQGVKVSLSSTPATYRFLRVLEHSVEIYGGLVAALFSAVGIWLGITLTRKKPEVVVKEVPVPVAGPFVRDEERLRELGITPRELEILGRLTEPFPVGLVVTLISAGILWRRGIMG